MLFCVDAGVCVCVCLCLCVCVCVCCVVCAANERAQALEDACANAVRAVEMRLAKVKDDLLLLLLVVEKESASNSFVRIFLFFEFRFGVISV